VGWTALGVCVALAGLACSQKSLAPEAAPAAPAASSAEPVESVEDEEKKKADQGSSAAGGASALERATAAPTDQDLTRPVGNSLGSRSLGGGDLSDISNRRPLDQRPIGNSDGLATESLGDRSRSSVGSGDIRDMRGEDATELQDRSLRSGDLRDASRERGSRGDLGERDWQGHPEE
jgi:hypothetical protein